MLNNTCRASAKKVSHLCLISDVNLDVDPLDVHADKNTFHRFDKFNLMYSPCGQSSPREIFLKQDNLIQGGFLAELTKQVLTDLDAIASWLNTEYPYIGESKLSGTNFASWIVNNELYSDNVVWLIQLPRLYNIYKEMGIVTSFQTILDFTIHTRLQLTWSEDYDQTEDYEDFVEARDDV
ncbi:AMP deaminase-like protein [Tanacetum coccineum]